MRHWQRRHSRGHLWKRCVCTDDDTAWRRDIVYLTTIGTGRLASAFAGDVMTVWLIIGHLRCDSCRLECRVCGWSVYVGSDRLRLNHTEWMYVDRLNLSSRKDTESILLVDNKWHRAEHRHSANEASTGSRRQWCSAGARRT